MKQTIRIAICDKEDAEGFKSLLIKYLPKIYSFKFKLLNSCDDLLDFFIDNTADILFVDMETDYKKALETVKSVRKNHKFCIIFAVAKHFSNISEIIRLNIFQLLEKPVNEKDLELDLNRALNLINKRRRHVVIKTKQYISKIPISNIAYVTVNNKRITLVTRNGEYCFSGSISHYEERLKAYAFVASHKSFLINLNFVESVSKTDLKLTGIKELIPVSRRYKANFMVSYKNFLVNNCFEL
jgi:DNA-binding LytR/AlgR family response regulator